MVLKISVILRKASNMKNCFAPINQIPAETLALVAAFLPMERDLINATAVCQQWRAILLSFPRLWYNAGGRSSELEAYLERSKSVPIQVNLLRPELVVSIIPHTSRLVDLTICVGNSREFNDATCSLRYPIPTLRSFEIYTDNLLMHHLELPSGIGEDLFLHLKKLRLDGILSLIGPQTFPHITELSLSISSSCQNSISALLGTLEQLPGLEKVHAAFESYWDSGTHSTGVVTLPCVQEMYLSIPDYGCRNDSAVIPLILQHLKFPKLTSLTVDSPSSFLFGPSILPVAFFSEHLPNYFELPEVRIDTTASSGKIVFRSPSQAVITFHTGVLMAYKRERQFWGDLPVSSVRRVTVVLVDPEFGVEDRWLVGMFRELIYLDLLELGGDCGWVLRCLRRRVARGAVWLGIRTLVVRGGEYARRQALKLESVKGDLAGLQDTTVTYIQDPEVREELSWSDDESSESDSSSDYSDE